MIAQRLLGSICVVTCLLGAATARAETSTPEKALASRLFDDAGALMVAGQTAAACAKYAESERLDPELGTLLHLGECWAKVGKTASAWASFKEAADIATQRNDPRAAKIKSRLASVEKTVSNLLIAVADSEPAGLEIRQDGALVGRPAWGAPIPTDPGEHKITATAPGAKPREVVATLVGAAQTVTVHLPPIEYLPEPAIAPVAGGAPAVPKAAQEKSPAPSAGHSGLSKQRVAAVVLGGVGVVGLGLGAAIGLMVKPTYDKSNPHCNGNLCDSVGHDFRQSAFSKATASDIAFAAGASALIGGTVLWLTAPKDHPSEKPAYAVFAPCVGPNLALLSIRRSW